MFQLPLPVAHKEKKVQAQIRKCGDRLLPAVKKKPKKKKHERGTVKLLAKQPLKSTTKAG